MKQIFDWKRFWCKPEGLMALDSNGFLLSPDDEDLLYKKTDVIDFGRINHVPCLILLGEPGIGKSIALHKEFFNLTESDDENFYLFFNLNEFSNEQRMIDNVFKSEVIEAWVHSNKQLFLFLDGFDECLLEIKTLPAIIRTKMDELKSSSSRMFLRISSRTGLWTPSLLPNLIDFFGSDKVQIYELAPLRKDDVSIAAINSGINPELFLKEIINREIQTLAIYPLTLNYLIHEYKVNSHFSNSKEVFFFNACKILCMENNYERELTCLLDNISPERRISLASRIAAVMIFCNKPIIDLKFLSDDKEYSLTLDMLSEGEEITDDFTFLFTLKDLKETLLKTSLFSSRGNLRFGFSNSNFNEFLAAKFITNHGLEIEQIKSLITISSDSEGKIIPQIKGTASWLGILSPNMTDYQIKNDPQNLLGSDLENLNFIKKQELVESLLRKFNDNSITDLDMGLRKQYKKLNYPGLSEQLMPFIQNPDASFLVRRVAINIAESCNLIELSGILLNIVLNPDEDINARKNAMHALITLGDQKTKTALVLFVKSPPKEDIDDELKGHALRALWPQFLTTSEAFEFLTPPKQNYYVGSYIYFIYMLENELRAEDLDSGLKWILIFCHNLKEIHYEFEHLETVIVYNSWAHFESINDKGTFARVLLNRMMNYKPLYPIPNVSQQIWKPLIVSDSNRLMIIKEIITIISSEDINLISYSGLVTSNDFYRIFDLFEHEENSELKTKWVKLLGMFNLTGPKEIDLILSNLDRYKELKTEFQAMFNPIEIESNLAKSLKQDWEKRKKWQKADEERKRNEELSKVNVVELIVRDLDDFEKNRRISSWFQLFMDLTLNESSKIYGDFINSNITSLPGWSIIPEAFQSKIVELSKEFILTYDEKSSLWFGSNSFNLQSTAFAFAGYKALILIMKHDPKFIDNLESRYWNNWRHVILDYPESFGIIGLDQTYLEIIRIAYSKIPDEIIEVLLAVIDYRNNSDEPHLFILNKVEACMDSKMQHALISKVQDSKLKPISLNYIFNKLLEKNNEDAYYLTIKLLKEVSGLEKIEVAKSLANYCHQDGWNDIMAQILADNEFGKEFFLSFIQFNLVESNPLLYRISEVQSAKLFLWLIINFPRNEDPVYEGAHSVGARESIGIFRDQILEYLTSKGTEESIEALKLIQKENPDLKIEFYLVEARKNFRKSSWEPLKPKEFLLLASNKRTRVILSSNDLLNFIIDSLARYEVILQGDNGISSILWDKIQSNRGKYKPKPEEVFSDVLRHHLNNELNSMGISTYREVQLRKPNYIDGGREGEITDIYVSYTHPKTKESLNVIIEVKGSWNKSVNTNMQNQLMKRYLRKGNCVHGLYLVGWYDCDAYEGMVNETSFDNIIDAREYYINEARKLSSGEIIIKSFVLDCSLKN